MSIILRQNEKLIKTVRQHSMFLMPMFFTWPLIIVVGLFVRYFFDFSFFGYWFWVLAVLVLAVILIILHKLYIWKNSALVITSQRLVKNEQRGFFSKTVTELLYKDVLEVSYDKNGISASLYDYGDLKIRTASENEIVFDKIADPDETVELINEVRQGGERLSPQN